MQWLRSLFVRLTSMTSTPLFTRVSARELLEEQLFEAERLALEHREAAAHHAALGRMYASRVKRLTNDKRAHPEPRSATHLVRVGV